MAQPPEARALFEARIAVADALGHAFEGFGVPRAAGRILGWLTVCDPAEQSAVDIAGALEIAPSTVSTMSRMLLNMGFARRITRPGERRRYLRARPGGWLNAMYHEVGAWRSVLPALERLRGMVADGPASSREGVEELGDFIHFIERELPALIERFHDERRARRSGEDEVN